MIALLEYSMAYSHSKWILEWVMANIPACTRGPFTLKHPDRFLAANGEVNLSCFSFPSSNGCASAVSSQDGILEELDDWDLLQKKPKDTLRKCFMADCCYCRFVGVDYWSHCGQDYYY